MITPEWLEDEMQVLTTHKALQESILRDIVRRLLKTDFSVTDTASWQAEKLQQAGVLFDDILAELAKKTKQSKEDIKKAFEDAKTEIFNYDADVLKDNEIDVDAFGKLSPQMARTYRAALKKTSTEAKNLTKTTAVTSQTAYIQASDLAHMQIASGAFSYQEAIKNAIKSAAVQGVNVLYPSGHISSLDAAVRRAVLTGVNQTAGKLQEMRADELECDLMEISAHYGARPSHAEWQGQIVSRSGRQGYLTLDDIGYGSVDGFMGANCRHDWFLYFEGSVRQYTAKQLAEMRDATVTYNGTEMSMYDARQKQRSMERSLRKTKQKLVAFDEATKNALTAEEKLQWQNEFNQLSVKLKSHEAVLKDFCNQTGLKRDRYREQVFATKTENGLKNWGKSTSQKAVWGNKKAVDNGGGSGIIKLNKSSDLYIALSREDLKVELSQQGIESVADKYGIDIKGKHFVIEHGAEYFSIPFYGRTDAEEIGRIDLYPRAFLSEEDLARTLIHEHAHFLQLKKYGKAYCEQNVSLMEKEAYRFEDLWYKIVAKRS